MPSGAYKNPKPKVCRTCGGEFTPRSGTQKACSIACKREWARTCGAETTERQYELISGNWRKYFNRLCSRSFQRDALTADILLELLDRQKGACALTGVEMTCKLQKGVKSPTNASIDRINAKGEYTADNIQLVCAIINKFRIDTPVQDFVEWCRKVAQHAVCK